MTRGCRELAGGYNGWPFLYPVADVRRLFVAGNWKMHGSRAESRARAQAVSAWSLLHVGVVDIALFPSTPYLATVVDAVSGSNVGVGAQDVHAELAGPFTGDVSAEMIADVGASYVIVGHSERRRGHSESDACVASKVAAALRARLTPVVCVGESLSERQAGDARRVIRAQLAAVLTQAGSRIAQCIVAYEPVWAIGTGQVATTEIVAAMHGHIREMLTEVSAEGSGVRILYGGSVNRDNAAALFRVADVDGALVGGASLVAEQFLAICAAAEETRAEETRAEETRAEETRAEDGR